MIDKKKLRLNWIAVISGHFLERYEVMTFSFFIPILTPLFFPMHDKRLVALAGMATFAAGYWARPLGGLIFGHIGDRLGRRVALLGSILCVTVPTLILSFLPTYEKIGLIAPLILVFCRLIQGISVGGEYSGAAVYFYEYSSTSKQGLSGGIMCATAFLGGVLGTLVGSISTYSINSEWGWRLPFLIGGLASLLSYAFRKYVIETPVFQALEKKKQTYPFIKLLRTKRKQMLIAILVGSQGHILLYTITLYFNSIILKNHQVSQFNIMALNTVILTIWVVLFVLFGILADKISKKKILMGIFSGIIILSIPLLLLLNQNFSYANLALFEIIFSIFGAGMFNLAASFLPSLFNPEERYSGVAVGQTIGQAILGGSAPLIATFLSPWTGEILAPVALIFVSSFFGLLLIVKESNSENQLGIKINEVEGCLIK